MFVSCKKSNETSDSINIESNKVAFFLTAPSKSTDAVKRVIQKLKEMEEANPFLATYIKLKGMANWEKSLISSPNTSLNNGSNSITSYGETTDVTIPIVNSNSSIIESLINARVTPNDVFINFLEDYQYLTLPFAANAQSNELSREDYAYFYFYFTNIIYGQTDFIINDPTLFRDEITAVLQPGQSIVQNEPIYTSFRALSTAPTSCFTIQNYTIVTQTNPPGVTYTATGLTTICIPIGLNDIFPNLTQIPSSSTPPPMPAGFTPGWVINRRYNKSPFALDENDQNNNGAGTYDNNTYPIYTGANLPTINNIISAFNFVGWSAEGIPSFSIDYAKAQIAIANYKISDYNDNTGNQPYGQTYKIYNENTGVNTNASIGAIGYISGALQAGIPVVVGVDCRAGASIPSYDNTTDHFVVIVGMGNDGIGNYFKFYDCSAFKILLGTSNLNKLYIRTNGQINGLSTSPYASSAGFHNYIITQIRRSKPL